MCKINRVIFFSGGWTWGTHRSKLTLLSQSREIVGSTSVTQGSYHYGVINITRTLIIRNDFMFDGHKLCYTVDGASFVNQDTPLKLADYFQLSDAFNPNITYDPPDDNVLPVLVTLAVDAIYHDLCSCGLSESSSSYTNMTPWWL